MEWDGTGSVRILFRPEELNIALGGVDRRRNGGAQILGGNGNAGADEGQDQRIFGSGSAGLITDEVQERLFHNGTFHWISVSPSQGPGQFERPDSINYIVL